MFFHRISVEKCFPSPNQYEPTVAFMNVGDFNKDFLVLLEYIFYRKVAKRYFWDRKERERKIGSSLVSTPGPPPNPVNVILKMFKGGPLPETRLEPKLKPTPVSQPAFLCNSSELVLDPNETPNAHFPFARFHPHIIYLLCFRGVWCGTPDCDGKG